MNIGREIRTVRILEQPEGAPQPVEEPSWPAEPKEKPASVPK